MVTYRWLWVYPRYHERHLLIYSSLKTWKFKINKQTKKHVSSHSNKDTQLLLAQGRGMTPLHLVLIPGTAPFRRTRLLSLGLVGWPEDCSTLLLPSPHSVNLSCTWWKQAPLKKNANHSSRRTPKAQPRSAAGQRSLKTEATDTATCCEGFDLGEQVISWAPGL